ncbi:metallophosphoesterase family protein [Fructobacillus ficulneus]|uniref:Putative Phosphoesterase n=1 Tax=Fructobacillus ficulneus TaxID=157463 RepID=A0A0K8MKV8_9LACO|nr:DNA repair exonuclease [Fructobacillus ficulneus]GAP00510.1 putative Phosphoesterase [Fructobacillus ficulneus]
MIKFIHAGDVHLGNPFTGLSQNLNSDFQNKIQEATYQALDHLVETAIDQDVDLVLFPGDLFHGSDNSALIQDRLNQVLRRLDQAEIWVAVSFGNHDFSQSSLAHPLWPDHVLVFGEAVETKTVTLKNGQKVALTGFSYGDRQHNHSELSEFPYKDQTVDYHLGLYHGVVGQDGEAYAAFNLNEMVAKGYDYWALGHIHQREILHENPVIAYSGNIQGLNRTEAGVKGFYLVSDTEGLELKPEFYPAGPVLWQSIRIANCPDFATLQDILTDHHFNQPTLLTIQLTETVGEELLANDEAGLLVEKLQGQRASQAQYWPIRVEIKADQKDHGPNLPLPAGVDFHEIINQVVQPGVVGEWLSDQAPAFVRDYFYSEVGQADLADRLAKILARGNDHED